MLGVTLVTGTVRRTKEFTEASWSQSYGTKAWLYDAQKLPNPYRATATEKAIRNRLHSEPAFEAMVCRIVKRVLRTWINNAIEGASPLVVIRCAFGKHRSVMVADEVARRLRIDEPEADVATMHLSTGNG